MSAYLSGQAPIGINQFTNNAYYITPTIAAGKGWGDFDIQATVGTPWPTSNYNKLGTQLVTNVAFQYHLLPYLWPEIELNDTYWFNGARGRYNQLFLTFDAIIGPYPIPGTRAKAALLVGYQTALTPHPAIFEPYHTNVQSQLAVRSAAVFLTSHARDDLRGEQCQIKSPIQGRACLRRVEDPDGLVHPRHRDRQGESEDKTGQRDAMALLYKTALPLALCTTFADRRGVVLHQSVQDAVPATRATTSPTDSVSTPLRAEGEMIAERPPIQVSVKEAASLVDELRLQLAAQPNAKLSIRWRRDVGRVIKCRCTLNVL